MRWGDAAIPVAEQPTDERVPIRVVVPLVLIVLAGIGWVWSARVAADMAGGGMEHMAAPMSLGAFVIAWAAMMAAMMLPAILPVVKLYARAAAGNTVAPLPFFVGGYLVLWTATAVPAYLAWRPLAVPVAEGQPWAGRAAGVTLIAAALWQISPLKSVCLRHCRSPLGFFLRYGGASRLPTGAFRMGVVHGGFCIGCCWAMFAVLVATASMSLLWMVAFTLLIVAEKNFTHGERVGLAAAPVLAALGLALLVSPSLIITIA